MMIQVIDSPSYTTGSDYVSSITWNGNKWTQHLDQLQPLPFKRLIPYTHPLNPERKILQTEPISQQEQSNFINADEPSARHGARIDIPLNLRPHWLPEECHRRFGRKSSIR